MQDRYENGEKETERNKKQKLGVGNEAWSENQFFFVLRG